ncbi:hypothetical protein V9L05_08015 [Bernardetia sp. Wsw4-3y2]|uniref:hypothetical protein n=1 Tax=Bernardetia sp. Wsw4-3y2 TaxID=3127471 RepID=UPI0030D415E1
MKKTALLIMLLIGFLQIQLSFGQSTITYYDSIFVKKMVDIDKYETDTFTVKSSQVQKQVLIGTTFLTASDKLIQLTNHGLYPISLELLKDCNNTTDPDTFEDYPKFIEVKRDSLTLTIDVEVVANCCHNFLGEAEVKGKDTLNLVYTSYGGHCMCNCVFTLRYKFDTRMEQSDYYPILKYVTINGSKTTGKIPNP